MKTWRMLIGPVLVLGLWLAITSMGLVKPVILPSPTSVLTILVQLLREGPLLKDAGATLYRTGIAFLISAVIGVIVGVPLGLWRWLFESIEVVFEFFRSMPSPALIPLAMLVFGLGDTSRIAVAAFTCSLINSIQATYAIRSIPTSRILGTRLCGARGFFLFRYVLFPSVLPGLVTGWRITLSLSLIIVVVSEMFIGTTTGLGMRIYDYSMMFRATEMYATILLVGIIGYILNKIVEVFERRFVHWAGR